MGQYIQSDKRDRDAYLAQAEQDYITRRQKRNATMQVLAQTIQEKRNQGLLGKEDKVKFNVDGYGSILEQPEGNVSYQDLFKIEKMPLNNLGSGIKTTSKIKNPKVFDQITNDSKVMNDAITANNTRQEAANKFQIAQAEALTKGEMPPSSRADLEKQLKLQKIADNKIKEILDLYDKEQIGVKPEVKPLLEKPAIPEIGYDFPEGLKPKGKLESPTSNTQSVDSKVTVTTPNGTGTVTGNTPNVSLGWRDKYAEAIRASQTTGSRGMYEFDFDQMPVEKDYKLLTKETAKKDPFMLDPVGYDYGNLMSNAMASNINQFSDNSNAVKLYADMAQKAVDYRTKFNDAMSGRGTTETNKVEDLGKLKYTIPGFRTKSDDRSNLTTSVSQQVTQANDNNAKGGIGSSGANDLKLENRSAELGDLGFDFKTNAKTGKTVEDQSRELTADQFWNALGGQRKEGSPEGIAEYLTDKKITYKAKWDKDTYIITLGDGTTAKYKSYKVGNDFKMNVTVLKNATQPGLTALGLSTDIQTNEYTQEDLEKKNDKEVQDAKKKAFETKVEEEYKSHEHRITDHFKKLKMDLSETEKGILRSKLRQAVREGKREEFFPKMKALIEQYRAKQKS